MVVGSNGTFGLATTAVLVAAIISAWFVQQEQPATHQASTTSPRRPAVATHADDDGSVGASPSTPEPAAPADALAKPSTVANESLPELTCDKAALFAWLRDDGGAFIHPSLVVRSSSPSAANSDADVRVADLGVYVNGTAIEAGELLFSVPEIPFALSVAAVAADLASQPDGDGDADARASVRNFLRGTEGIHLQLGSSFIEDEQSARRYLSLAVALLCERRKAQLGVSRWRHYLACLPSISACPVLPCFNKHERNALQDNFAGEVARSEQATLRSVYEAIDWVGMEGGCFERPPRKAEWLWAVRITLSLQLPVCWTIRTKCRDNCSVQQICHRYIHDVPIHILYTNAFAEDVAQVRTRHPHTQRLMVVAML